MSVECWIDGNWPDGDWPMCLVSSSDWDPIPDLSVVDDCAQETQEAVQER